MFIHRGTTIPWTTLDTQHRMRPKNREIVSQLSYRGLLKDAKCVLERKPFAEKFLSSTNPRYMSPVIVLQHDFTETRVCSFCANIIK